jgi:hypothetical protein
LRPPSRPKLIRHLTQQAGYAAGLVALSLGIGMAGYHWIAGLSWVDAFQNAAMLLGGMGPVGEGTNASGKIFAGLFALYAGLVFLVVTALVLTPVFHYALHRLGSASIRIRNHRALSFSRGTRRLAAAERGEH